MTYAQEQRIRMIDFLLANYGHVGRKPLQDYFGIAEACASRDLATYRDLAPLNTYFDEGTKQWHRAASFKRLYA